MEQTSQFSLNAEFSLNKDEDGIKTIEGFAIHGGEDFVVHDLFLVPESEMKNCAKTLKGAKLMKDHNYEVDSIVGKVDATKVTHDESCDMEGVYYKASLMVDDTKLGEKIDAGLVDATSIGFQFTPICSECGNEYFSDDCPHSVFFDDIKLITQDMNIHELSLVAFGADPNATATSLSDNKTMREKFGKLKEDFIMATKNDTKTQELQEENLKLSQEVKDLEAKLAEQEKEFQTQIEDLKLETQEQLLTLAQEKETLEAEFEKVGEELATFRAEKQAQIEAELAAKKEELVKLAQELKVEETIGDVEEMSAEFIDKQIAVFKKVIENTPKVKQFTGEADPNEPVEGKERKQFDISKFFINRPVNKE